MCKVLTAIDIANFFIEIYKYDDEQPTNRKLNKLLYYFQGHSLKRFGKVLFEENIEAWDIGPVVKSVYDSFKIWDEKPIKETLGDFDVSKYTEDVKRLLLDIGREYGQFTGTALTYKLFKSGNPWERTYIQGSRNIIPIDLIKDYFAENEECRTLDFIYGEG